MYNEDSAPEGGAERRFVPPGEQADRGRPLLATAIGCVAVLVLAGGARNGPLPTGPNAAAALAGEVAGGILAAAGIVWAIAYFATLRKASTAWKAASLILFILLSAFANIGSIGRNAAFQDDAAETANMVEKLARSDDPLSERIEGGKGTFSKMTAAVLNSTLADSKRYEEELAAAGVEQVLSLDTLTHESPVLDRCNGVSAIAQRAEHYGSRLEVHLAAGEAVGKRAVAAGAFPAEAVEGFLSGARTAQERQRRQWELQAEMVRESGAICKILAARKWRRSGSTVEFQDPAQADAVNAHLSRVQAHGKELLAIQDAARKATSETFGVDFD